MRKKQGRKNIVLQENSSSKLKDCITKLEVLSRICDFETKNFEIFIESLREKIKNFLRIIPILDSMT